MAGDHAGSGFAGASRFSGGIEFSWIQRGARGGTGLGRHSGGGGGIGVVVSAECGVLLRRDSLLVPLASCTAWTAGHAAGARCDPGGLSLRSGRTSGEIGSDSHGGVQRGSDFPAGAASGDLSAAWGAGLRVPADLLWIGSAGRSGGAAAPAAALFGGRAGGGGDPGVCDHDILGGAGA